MPFHPALARTCSVHQMLHRQFGGLLGRELGPRHCRAQHAPHVRHRQRWQQVHRQFHGFSDDELKRIPLLPQGTRLEQGATYVDLNDPQLREIKALGSMKAGQYNWYVPKSEVDYQLWNRLIGITNPERLGDANEA